MRWEWRQLHWPSPLDHGDALGLLQRLAADEQRGPVVLEARAEAGVIRHLIGSGETNLSGVLSVTRRLIPGVIVADLDTPRASVERAGRVRIRRRNLGLSLDTTSAALRALLAALSSARGKGDVLVLQVILGASVPPQVAPDRPQDPNLSLFDLVTTGTRPAPAEVRADMRAKLSQYRIRATIRLGVSRLRRYGDGCWSSASSPRSGNCRPAVPASTCSVTALTSSTRPSSRPASPCG